MEELFNNKYRTKSIRLKHWDYSKEGSYYITICTKDREPFFGKIINNKINLSEVGRIVDGFWKEIPKHYEHVSLDEFVIMPDHLHGIICINDNFPVETPQWGVSKQDKTPQWGVSTKYRNSNHKSQWKPNSIGSIICQFKSICTKKIQKIGYLNFEWQSNYYDHIIRNEKDFNRIRKYIRENPLKKH